MLKKNNYYFRSSNRRQNLDKLQKKYLSEYRGIVLDIGGRDRGIFIKPKDKVEKWIFADIQSKNNPDIVLDVADMNTIDNETIDIVCAMELFEHVEQINAGIKECYRVLKKNGKLMLSVPFLYPVHADPFDFQRWTLSKWTIEFEKLGFNVEVSEIMGRFFTVKNSMSKNLIHSFPIIIRHMAYILFPFLNIINKLDDTSWVKSHPILGNYHGGYFFIVKK